MRSSRHAPSDPCTLQAAHHYSITKGYTFTVGFEKGGRLRTRRDTVAAPDSARQHGRFRTRRDNVAGPLRPRPTPSVGHILWVGIVGHLVPPPVRTGPTLVSALGLGTPGESSGLLQGFLTRSIRRPKQVLAGSEKCRYGRSRASSLPQTGTRERWGRRVRTRSAGRSKARRRQGSRAGIEHRDRAVL